MNDLVIQNTDLAADIGQTDEISWTGSENMSFDQYQAIGRTFQQIQHSLSWWMGDWMNYGEQKFGDIAAQAVEDTGKSIETLLKWKAVAFRVSRQIRRKELGWTHHFYVAYVPEEYRGPLLDMAVNLDLASRQLKEVVKLAGDDADDPNRFVIIDQFLLAYDNYMAEQGPMDMDTFLAMLNRFKLAKLNGDSKPRKEKDEDGDDDDEDNPGTGESAEEALREDIQDFWENEGHPVTFINDYSTFWSSISVRAALDKHGKPRLIWEKVDNGE